jgi:hypothetical protein
MARRVFLSFAYEDRMQVQGFKLLRWNNNVDLDFFDSSLLSPVNSQNTEYIKRCILEKLNNTSVTVVLIGQTTHKSNWVAWEIEQSLKKGNGILGIRLKDQDNASVPPAMHNIAHARIGNWIPDNFSTWIEDVAKLAERT